MLPPIPDRLLKIDEVTVGEHFSLDAADTCFYIWEYAARKGYTAGPTNHLIKNLKIKPGELATAPARRRYKQQAIDHAANALRKLLGQQTVEGPYSFVPIPPSKAIGDADYDDRISQLVERAFSGWNFDLQPILRIKQSMPADHETAGRINHDGLHDLMEVLQPVRPVRSTIIILDDVLNSGKHFKVAKSLISLAHPGASICGLFLARCTRNIESIARLSGP